MTGVVSILSSIETWAPPAMERAIRSLPEGILIALFAWGVLRVLPKQNSRTRFAVWFVALLAVVGLACFGSQGPHSGIAQNAISEWGRHGVSSTLGLSLIGSISSRVSAIHLSAEWASYAFFAWVGIAFLGLARLAAGLWHLRSLRRSCAPVEPRELDPSVAATLEELNGARRLGGRRATLAVSERVRVPAALGLWSPMIVLPGWALEELPAGELSIILRHEFAHLRRWDDWTNLAQKIARAVFFFHPAVWWIESRLSAEREMACDDIVLAETGNAMGYASCLVSLLERSLAQRGWTMAQAIVHRAREASERVAQILAENRPAARGISKAAVGLVGTFAALCVAMLPATPQFVAFDRETGTAAEHPYAAGLARPAGLRTVDYRSSWRPVGIPAALKSSEPAARGTNVGASTVVRADSLPRKSGAPSAAVSPKSNDIGAAADSGSGGLISSANEPSPLNVAADRDARLAMQTLLLVRDAQFVTAEFPVTEFTVVASPRGPMVVWSVQMMRVTFVAPIWREQVRMGVAKKT